MRVHQVGVHTPVLSGRSDDLRRVIADLPTGAASPLASLPGTHYARLVVVDGVRAGSWFVCSAVTDVAASDYLDVLLTTTGELPERLWSHCTGWPGSEPTGPALAYLRRHIVRPTLPFATWEAPLDRIQDGLALRRKLIEFAPDAQDCTPEQLLAAFRKTFAR